MLSFFKRILCFFGCACASYPMQLRIGQQAPAFSLVDDHGKVRMLSECRGKKIALVLYPKDGSLYCTKQAQNIKVHFQKLTEKNIMVFGISSDATKKHQAFKKKYDLPFDLLTASTDFLEVYDAGGIFFNTRKTILIDELGIIVTCIEKVDVQNHAQQILDGFGVQKTR